MLLLASTAVPALSASERLLTTARTGPLYVSSAPARRDLAALVDAAAAERPPPEWPRDAELLCVPWQLVATTNTASAGPLLPLMNAQPDELGAVGITQRWQQADGALRCDNAIKISRPASTLSSSWTLLPVGGESSLTLRHTATVVTQQSPLRLQIALDEVVLDANRRAGEPVEEIIALPVPSLPPLPSLLSPLLSLPSLPSAVGDAGTFDVLLLDESVRVVRGVD
eukprot:483130-Prymnesium_polylepis.1